MSEVKTDSVVNVSGDNDSGIDLSTNDVVAIKTADTERLRIDSGGNVGIGTSSPTQNLDVSGTGNQAIAITSTDSGDTSINFADTDNNIGKLTYQHSSNAMLFRVNDAERMRIDSTGKVGIGYSSPASKLNVNGTVYFNKTSTGDYTSGFEWQGNNGALVLYRTAGVTMLVGRSNSGEAIRFNRATSDVGSIDVSVASTSYNTSSDHRLKENVADMTGAIDRVKQLAPKRFNFIVDADTTVDGFLAHEAQAVVPEAVTGTHNEVDDDGNAVMQGIDHSKLVPLLTGALQEAITKIEALEARVTALENA